MTNADISNADVPDADISDTNVLDANILDEDVPDADISDADIPDANISTVFLDLDDTICEHPRSTADRLADAFEVAGVEPFFGVDDFRRWLAKVSADTTLELREKCFTGIAEEKEEKKEDGGNPADARAVAHAYEDPDPETVEFLPGAQSALESLSASHDLALVTNGGRETQTAKLAALDIADHFDAVTFAGSDHAVKPDPEPFDHTLAQMGVSAAEAVHVGNSLRADVAGAQAAGIGAVWLEQPDLTADHALADYAPDHTIASMHDLHAPPWI